MFIIFDKIRNSLDPEQLFLKGKQYYYLAFSCKDKSSVVLKKKH